MRMRNRVPGQFFVTKGSGESDVTVHAGSYHLALLDAGIEMANIMTYSSILPATAELIEHPGKDSITHGEVMETIMADSSCTKGQTATAGIIYAWLSKKDGSLHGGLVCEYSGDLPPNLVPDHLREMLNELYTNGYQHMDLSEPVITVDSITPSKKYGTALVALCFLDHYWMEMSLT